MGRVFRDGVEVSAEEAAVHEVVVDPGATESTAYAANTGYTVPLNSDGSSQSIYGPNHQYLTQDDLAVPGIFDQDDRAPATSGDDEYLWADAAREIVEVEPQDVDEQPADAAQYADQTDQADYEEVQAPAEGPLPDIEGHTWSDADQVAAAWWMDRVIARASQLESVSEEDALALAAGLSEDYAHLYGTYVVAQDREMMKSTRAALMDELGDAYHPNLGALDGLLRDQTIFQDGMGELLVTARVPGGARLINVPQVARGLMKLATRADRYIAAEVADDTAEIDALNRLMDENIGEFQQLRRFGPNRNMTGSQRLYQLLKKREAA
jgi:hypothetical protein